KDVMTSRLITTTFGEDLNTILIKLTRKNIDALPVVEENDPKKLISMIYRRDIITFYNDYVRKNRET
ncbi:MAG: chloride channel protein, partial [Acidobacteria bacterium]